MLITLIYLAFVLCCSKSRSLSSTTIAVPAELGVTPISLSNLLTTNGIRSVQIIMGHLTYRVADTPFSDGIIARIIANHSLDSDIVTRIAASFSVSEKQAFRMWDAGSNTLLIADPNDKLCTQQIQALLKLIFPCKSYLYTRLAYLHSVDQLTSGYLGIKIIWKSTQTTLQIIREVDNHIQSEHYVMNTTCGRVEVQNWLPDQRAQGAQANPSFRGFYKVITLSKWYNPTKTIAFIINPQNNPNISHLSFKVRLPVGFIPNSLSLKSAPSSYSYTIVKSEDQSHLIRINVSFPLLHQKLELHLSFSAGIPLFQKFEAIAGGGEELMVLSIVDKHGGDPELYSHRISQQLLQPDFSINFKVITSYAAALLLIWLTLWRQHELSPSTSSLEDPNDLQ